MIFVTVPESKGMRRPFMSASEFETRIEPQPNDDLFRFITENSSDIITLHTATTIFRYVSPIVRQILGYAPEEWVGQTPLDFIHPNDRATTVQRFRDVFTNRERSDIVTFVYRVQRSDGKYAWIESTARSVHQSNGAIEGFIAVSRDISERKRTEDSLRTANERLQKLSTIDGLTGIANRRYFDEALRREWSRGIRNHYPISLILFDIDYFKYYNDYYGHPQGDECLKAIAAKTLETFPRSTDFVARYGGEEFAVILPNTPSDMSEMLATRLREYIAAMRIPHEKSSAHPYVTVSIGVAHLEPTLSVSPDTLIAQADQALYESKNSGRNRVSLYAAKQ